ncbi:MAG: hypothetical protein IJY59_10345 [Bacteroidaceae bacterium]|nr:hypothetical protein [Bacteroidaceae bacterium]
MNDSRLTIRWSKNEDCTTDISVCGEVNSYPYFKEAFLSLDRPMPVRDITDKETESENGANSATKTLLTNLIGIIGKSVKTDSKLVDKNDFDMRFPFADLPIIRKFAEIADIEFDESKFSNRREFQRYFATLLK